MADGDVIVAATARRYWCDAGVVVAQVDAATAYDDSDSWRYRMYSSSRWSPTIKW